MKVKTILTLARASFGEYIARNGIRYLYTLHPKRALLALRLTDLVFKGTRRGVLLSAALHKTPVKERYAIYERRIPELRASADQLRKQRFGDGRFSRKVFSLMRGWEKRQWPPRQVQQDVGLRINVKLLPPVCFRNKRKKILHVITEDHELSITPGKSEGKPFLSLREAEIQLIKKGRLVNTLASECGTPWTHLVDIGSYLMIERAAQEFPGTWGRLVEQFEEFLVDTISSGNDLGMHAHPDKSPLAISSIERDKIWISSAAPSWGELPLGCATERTCDTKIGMLMLSKELLEKHGRLADPSYRACFFRAGGYSTGRNRQETIESMIALSQAGIVVASDALEVDGVTESLGRLPSDTVYLAEFGAPWRKAVGENATEKIQIQALPVRTSTMPVYSVMTAARRHSKSRSVIRDLIDAMSESNGYLISIDHDINIGSGKYGGGWDSLDLNRGDWAALREYLCALRETDEFEFVGVRVLVDDLTLQLGKENDF